MNKTIIFALTIALLTASALYAQVVSDPNDPLYTDLRLWQERGLITGLPELRPYPIQLVERYLGEVEVRGNADDRARAQNYATAIGGFMNAHPVTSALVRSDLSHHYEQVHAGVQLQGSISPLVSFSAVPGAYFLSDLGPYTLSGAPQEGAFAGNYLLPEYERTTANIQNDSSVSALAGLYPRISLTSNLSVGDAQTYFQAGIARSSFGPFWGDNAVLSPTAPVAGRFSFTWRGKGITYSSLLDAISAVNSDGTGGPSSDKYLVLHSLELYPLSWLRLGIFESIVWGPSFEPVYLLPLPTVLFFAQGLYGYPGNSLIGLSGGVTLPHNIRADLLLYVDDAGFNNLVKLDFNTMFVAAFQSGLSWTPNLPFLTRLSLNNLLVTPYTYTHDSPTTTNYQDYTNAGVNMGPSLQPNSDRIEVSALLRPAPFAEVNLFGRYILHGNASDINGTTVGNGTIFDSGYTPSGPTFTSGGYPLPPGVPYTRFLDQPVLEQTFQAGLSATLTFESPAGPITGTLSYTFQHVANVVGSDGNPQPGVDSTTSYLSVGLGMRF